jgi:hypothetical protein
MVQLKKEKLNKALSVDTTIFKRIVDLVGFYPWNNFFQLKVLNLFEELLNKNEDEDLKKFALESSGIGHAITELSKQASFEMDSKNMIRNGFMGVVIDIANKLVKRTE